MSMSVREKWKRVDHFHGRVFFLTFIQLNFFFNYKTKQNGEHLKSYSYSLLYTVYITHMFQGKFGIK